MQTLLNILAGFWQISSITLLLDVGRYVVAAGGLALILKLFWNWGLKHRKIQARWASNADVRREILTSLRNGVIFSLNGVAIVFGVIAGFFTVYRDFDRAGVGYLVISVVAIIVAHDAYFYWTHRLMHHPRLYPYFHRTHHRSVTPTPFAAYAFDVPEALLMAADRAEHVALAVDPTVFDLTDRVRETIQSTLYRLLVQRRSVWR